MELSVFDTFGKDTGRKLSLDSNIFGLEENSHLVYLDVKRYLASQRYTVGSFKGRSDVSGTTKKIKKQKGTGTARAGSAKSHLFVGGGISFGGFGKRNYTLKMNKSASRKARLTAMSAMFRDHRISVVEDFSFEKPRTKKVIEIINNLKFQDKTLLFIPNSQMLSKKSDVISLSVRNVPKVNVSDAMSLNTYQIVRSARILFFESALKSFQEKYKSILGLPTT